jgi:hypothetical protein
MLAKFGGAEEKEDTGEEESISKTIATVAEISILPIGTVPSKLDPDSPKPLAPKSSDWQ